MRSILNNKKLVTGLVFSHLVAISLTYFITKDYYTQVLSEKDISEKQVRTLFLKSQDIVETSGNMLTITENMWNANTKGDINTVNSEYEKLNSEKEKIKQYNAEMDKLMEERTNYPFKYFKVSFDR